MKTGNTTRRKKAVGRTLICNPTYVRRIDPIWCPGPVPRGFWDEASHRRDYLIWLAHRLRFRWMEDYYRLTTEMLVEHYGSHVARTYWRSSSYGAVKDCFPQYDWQEWLFSRVPGGFWKSRTNCRRYLRWLGERLGYRHMDDWYGISYHDFARNKGLAFINGHRGSPALAVMTVMPRPNWCPWRFLHVPPGYWERAENRHHYLRWLGRQLGFRRSTDWYGISHQQIAAHYGVGLLGRRRSLYDLMREFLPRLDWERHWRRWPISVERILEWADTHKARQGDWPTMTSGAIPGTDVTWACVNGWLRHGHRGLLGGSSLSRCLYQHRDVKPGRTPPPLSQQQVLAWADAHFAAQGKWPTVQSGPVSGTRETWLGIDSALRSGGRGLHGGTSLAQLLARRRGVRNRARRSGLRE